MLLDGEREKHVLKATGHTPSGALIVTSAVEKHEETSTGRVLLFVVLSIACTMALVLPYEVT